MRRPVMAIAQIKKTGVKTVIVLFIMFSLRADGRICATDYRYSNQIMIAKDSYQFDNRS